jgi:hypothetical protein
MSICNGWRSNRNGLILLLHHTAKKQKQWISVQEFQLLLVSVIPAMVEIQGLPRVMDPRFRGDTN